MGWSHFAVADCSGHFNESKNIDCNYTKKLVWFLLQKAVTLGLEFKVIN